VLVTARVVQGVPPTPLGDAVVAIGMFDGVHLGHQALLERTVALARERALEPAVVTFDTDPEHVLRPAATVPQLLDLDDRIRHISAAGIATVLVLGFDRALASLTAADFLDAMVLPAFPPQAIVVGSDFRLGRGGESDASDLAHLAAERGSELESHPLVAIDGADVSATRIRALIAEGAVRAAASLLGRPHVCKGPVVPGRGAGHRLGAPTANVDVDREVAVPSDGVYACMACLDDVPEALAAAVSVGQPPTYENAPPVVEAHLIDFGGDIYGRTLRLGFVQRLREQERFAHEDALAEAIAGDVERVRALVRPGPGCANL
jgi:riboflavin kinase/FMN adenylyltransferase